MGISIWYQSGVDFDHHPGYSKALTRRFEEVASPGTKVSLHGSSRKFNRGLSIVDCVSSPYAYHQTYIPMFLDAVTQAERTGHDAFVIATFSEPVLREMRSLATIPVVSASECSLLTACTVAPRIGLVTLSRLAEGYILKSIATHHLESRVSGVHVVDEDMTESELDTNFDTPAPYIERFKNAARVAIVQGADAIIPAEGLVAAMMAVNHVHEVDQIPIIDSIAAAVLFAEYAVAMQRRAGLEPSRRYVYARPSAAALAALTGKD
ncbi:MAG: aspartate/glutamate racemase family protein [Alphaproteobacteria bacterium]